MTRMNLTSPRKRNDKTFWVSVGSAFPTKDGTGFQLVFDALPLPDADGRVVVLMSPPREDNAPRQQRQTGGAPAGGMEDEIPFSMEWR